MCIQQKMQPDRYFLSQDRTKSFLNKHLSLQKKKKNNNKILKKLKMQQPVPEEHKGIILYCAGVC